MVLITVNVTYLLGVTERIKRGYKALKQWLVALVVPVVAVTDKSNLQFTI